MRSLLKLLVTLILLGTAAQQGWLQAGTRFVADLFGSHPGLVPYSLGVTGAVAEGVGRFTWIGLSATIRNLPDPWFTLAILTAGVMATILLVTFLRTAIRTTLRVSGWLKDVWV